MPRYNLALIPKTKQPSFIACAQQFQDDTTDYLLGPQSIPHITLVQFRTDDDSVLEQIWHTASQAFTSLEMPLMLTGPHWIDDMKREHFIWLQLMPHEPNDLHHIHMKLVAILNHYSILPINRSLELYEPHLTLAHTAHSAFINTLQAQHTEISDEFYLALGLSDEIGQFLKIIK